MIIRDEFGYNDLGWYDTSAITPHIECYKIIPLKARVFLHA